MPPVCTGLYKIVDVRPGVGIDMVSYEVYFEGPKPRASIQNLHYRTTRDRDAHVIELLAGQIISDAVSDLYRFIIVFVLERYKPLLGAHRPL